MPKVGARKIAQQLRALALSEVLGLVPRIHRVIHNHLYLWFQGNLIRCAYIHTDGTFILIKRILK